MTNIGRSLLALATLVAIFHGLADPTLRAAESPREPTRYLTRTLVDDGDPATDDRGWATTSINSTSFKTQAIATFGNSQFLTYYGADGNLNVARRHLTAAPAKWTILRTKFLSYNLEDPHNTSSLALDGDGFLHVAWGMHGGGPLLYSRSLTSVDNDGPLRLHGDDQGNAGMLARQIPLQNDTSSITYPEFWNIPGSGDLLLTYRSGSSGNGEYQLARWVTTDKKWIAVHVAMNTRDDNGPQPWIDNKHIGAKFPNANAYHNGLAFDGRGRVHVSWTWRTGGDSLSGFDDFQTNHHILYAYSDNFGMDWRRDDGSLYERNGRHDIDEDNARPVVTLPPGSSLINAGASVTGPDNVYYLATYWAPLAATGNHLRQYMLVEYDGTRWKTHQITNRKSENDNQRIPEARLKEFRISRPIVAIDRENRVLVAFCDYQRGGRLTIAYSEKPTRDDWRFLELTEDNAGRWEPRLDRRRWETTGILSMYYQPSALGEKQTPVSVLEWNAQAFFAAGGK